MGTIRNASDLSSIQHKISAVSAGNEEKKKGERERKELSVRIIPSFEINFILWSNTGAPRYSFTRRN